MPRPTGMFYDAFTYENGDVDVFRRVPRTDRISASEWVLWVLVRPSRGRSKGLFAGRAFAIGDTIGRYCGRVLGRAENPAVATAVGELSSTPAGDAIAKINGVFVDARRPMQSNAVQMQLIERARPLMSQPEWRWPGAYVHMANDPRGTRFVANAELTRGGYFQAIRPIRYEEELLWDYGDEFWEDEIRLNFN